MMMMMLTMMIRRYESDEQREQNFLIRAKTTREICDFPSLNFHFKNIIFVQFHFVREFFLFFLLFVHARHVNTFFILRKSVMKVLNLRKKKKVNPNKLKAH